ncbi:F0F1 ATP synthase subunit B [Alkalihalobacillus sp. AL-G]|uniref:F0F1 ATP synthase subunit B n=1 Tax=Alkalihalobacillus sp. AL-G TaxID=2926399 RepID=UPI00351B1B23
MFNPGNLVLGAAGFNAGDILFQLLAFLILLFLLRKYAFGPLMGMMRERERHISNEINEAEKNRKDAETYLKQQTEALTEARKEAQTLIEAAKKQGEHQGEDILQAAREEADRMKEAALAEIGREKEQAVQTLRNEVAALSVQIASKVIAKELDEKNQEKLVEDYLKEVGEVR